MHSALSSRYRNTNTAPFLTFLLMIAVTVAGQGTSSAQRIPFVLPWNDSSPGITDLSGMNPVIGPDRVQVDTNAHFVVNGQRVRFLGMNFAGDSPFMPTNKAEAVAARLAKFGINNVRFHHMDASWAYNGGLLAYNSVSSTNVNPTNLERLHFLVSRLKAHGIYSDVNLLVGREYRSGDGLGPEVTSMDWKDAHVLGFFFDPALRLHKDYARKLLAPTNRFTGLPLAKDPAVSFVEIINENGIVQKWLDGGLDRLPARYMTNLQARWNTWLGSRYGSDTVLLAAWNIIDRPLGTNLLRNGAFSNALTSWNSEQHNLARATFSRNYEFLSNQPSAKITVTTPDTVSWYIQFNQAGVKLVSNEVYTISFWAKSSPATNASAAVMRAHTDYAGLGYGQDLSLTTNWQQFTTTYQSAVTETNARVNFGSMGDKAATFWYADVRLQTGGKLGTLPAGSSLVSHTMPVIAHAGNGYTGTRAARRDWLRFLRQLENDYYADMTSYIRTNIGYEGLIFGTIMANSPATVQSTMDVIDSHAYWQHPQFPGQPWDSVNWLVPNLSMINTLGADNNLEGLSLQRIKGKPFTVTEYQHPSPNYYGSEGPLLLAAYGALQDWDGFWMFDYGQGNDMVPMGMVRGFFDTAQHPGKMANLWLAANLFRRANVSRSINEYTMQLTPEHELDLLETAGAWGVFSATQLGMPGRLPLISRVNTTVGENAQGLTTPPPAPSGNILSSDTGELVWNLAQAGKGLVTINTPRTKAIAGFADGKPVQLGGITFQPGTTQLGWCTLALSAKSGEVLTNDCSAILVATASWENTGQIWKDSQKNSVGNKWGQAPVLVEVVPFSITLPVPTNYVRFWSLDTRGQRTAEIPISGDATSSVINVGTNSGTIWYELQVARWVASFDLWRSRYFTTDELTDPLLSSEAASPDGDRVPNLLKYFFGLPGRTPASADALPMAFLNTTPSGLHLAMGYDCDGLATDLAHEVQVSSDLRQWLSGSCCVSEQVLGGGPLARTVAQDLAPVSVNKARFMRLRVWRR